MALNSFLYKIMQLSAWLAILAVVFVPLEYLFRLHPKRIFRKEIGTDLIYYFVNSIVPALALSVPAALLGRLVRHYMPSVVFEVTGALPVLAAAVLALVAGEVGYYWGHRWSHEVPFLWRFHAVHHSAEELDFLVNTRAHPVDMVFSHFCGIVPLYVLGLAGPTAATGGSQLPALVLLVGVLWGFFVHANIRWRFGPLEWIISTPMFHHWHHTKTGPIDHNYSAMFPWIDSFFGSLHLPGNWPESYGIEAPMPHGLVGQIVNPFVVHGAATENESEKQP